MKFLVMIAVAGMLFACNNAGPAGGGQVAVGPAQPSVLTEMEQQLRVAPGNDSLRLQYALLLDSLALHNDAIRQMDTLVQHDSANNKLWFIRGQLAENAQDTLEAMKSYAVAASIYETPDALLALANLYAEQKNNRAVYICSRVKALRPGREYDAFCAFITGVYFARSGQPEEAIKYFDESIAYNYTYMEAYIEKGLVYFDKQQYRKALAVFQFAATVNNLYADAYYFQARCYEMLQVKDSAILRFKQSLQLDPQLTEAKEKLALLEK